MSARQQEILAVAAHRDAEREAERDAASAPHKARIDALIARYFARIRECADLLIEHIQRREQWGTFGVFPSTAARIIPIMDCPAGVTDFMLWAATGVLLNDGRLRPMSHDEARARHVGPPVYWPEPWPLATPEALAKEVGS